MIGTVYRTVGRRFSTLLVAAVGGAFAFDMVFNRATEAFWDNVSC